MRWDTFIKSRTHNNTFGESRNILGVQLLTSQKKSREGWQHPPHPSSCPFHSLTCFLSSLQRRGELGHTPNPVAGFTPQNAGQKGPQEDEKGCRKSEQAHVLDLRMASLERRMPTDLFMHSWSVRTKEKRGVWKWRIWGQPCAM